MTRLKIFFLLCFLAAVPAFLSGCAKFMDENEELEEEDPAYVEVRKNENERVSRLLQCYAKGGGEGDADSPSYDRLNIAFMTDSHVDLGPVPVESRRNLRDAIDFCNSSKVPISAIIHGGDLVTAIMPTKSEHIAQLESCFELTKVAKMPFLFSKGNHDLNAINVPPSSMMSDSDWDNMWYDQAEKEYGIERNVKSDGQKSGYYYYDLDSWKVRIVCLDCFDVDYSKTDSKENILYWGGTSFYLSNEQFQWVIDTALDFDDKEEKDWGVIVFTHFYRPSDSTGTSVQPVFESVYKKLNSVLLAFNKQSSCAIEYSFPQNDFYNLSIKGDWTRYSGLEKKPYLICVLSGHQHTDIYMNWWGVAHIVTANQFCGKEASDERILRQAGTRSQNLFDIVNIDLKERKLRVIRYGASANLDGQEGNRFLKDGLNF